MLLIYIVILGISGHLAVNGQPYGPWSEWSECSVDEGQGVMSRTRPCIVNDCPDLGDYLEFMACFVKPCKCECPPEPGTEAPSKASTTSGIQIELSEEPSTVPTGGIEIGVSEEPTTVAENVTTQPAQNVSTGTISIGLVEETTTAAPQKSTAAPSEETTAVPPATNETTAAPGEETTAVQPATNESTTAPAIKESTAAPGEETTAVPPATEESTAAPSNETTAVPPATQESTAAPGEKTTAVPPATNETTAAPSGETTALPPATNETTAAPSEETTAVQPATNETTAAPSEETTAVQPATNESTAAPSEETTAVPPATEETTGAAPVNETTAVPLATNESTAAPSEKTTAVPTATEESTEAPNEETTAVPLATNETTAAPGEKITAVPPATQERTEAPSEETTAVPQAIEGSTEAPNEETTPAQSATQESTAAPGKETAAVPPEIPCEDNPLGAAEGGKLPSSSFTAPTSYAEYIPSAGRLNGPLAWCSQGDVAGQEFLQIHVPEAEVICAVAIQGSGYGEGDEHVKEYYLEYSEDGLNWQVVEADGNQLKIFKGNDDSKSTSKQELPEPVEAKYIRIYPLQYEGWMCLRAELYGKEKAQAAPFPTVPEKATEIPNGETTAVSQGTRESTSAPGEETTAVPTATEETTAAPNEEETAVPLATEETTAAPNEETTAVPPGESTAAPGEETTAVPQATGESTGAPGEETTAVPPEESTAAPTGETTAVPPAAEESTAAPGEGTTAVPPEIPCEDNPLGAAEGGKLPSSSFEGSPTFGIFVASTGRLDGPVAWCSQGLVPGREFLQIHVPEAEVICAVATQGTGFGSRNEHVKQYYLEYSRDGINWKMVDEDGNLKIFKGNDDAKSTSKQELPEPVEAKYIRIYPVEYEGWMCLRAELYGKERTQAAPFPTVPEKATEIPNGETTAVSPGTGESTAASGGETTAVPPATEETTAAPNEEETAVPAATEETTAAPNEETTAVPPGESTSAPGEETTAVPQGESTGAPGEEITAVPPEESTAAPTGETTAVPPATEEITAAPGEGTTAVPPEIPCEDNPLGAAEGGKLPSSSFEGSPTVSIFVASTGRLNGPLAWCSQGVVPGQEFLQIHVPEAEVICAVATQGTGFGSGNEHVKEYYLGYSRDGINWKMVEERGNLKIFKGNDDAKSTSKQELPEPVEAKYIRIYPVEYEGWMCLRAELYGKERTQAPFPTGAKETTGAAQIKETTAVPPATEETFGAVTGETTAAPPGETTAAPGEETSGVPPATEENTALPNEETTAVSPGETTVAPGEETTVPPGEEKSTTGPSEETTAVPSATGETTAAPGEETTAVQPATESELPTTGQETVTPSARVIPPAPTGEVKGKGLDIGILIDSSFGLSPDEFEQLKQFISQLIFWINMQFTNVHFGIIVYSDLPDLVITLQNVDQLDVVSVIDGVKYLPGGHRTDLAMLYASRKLFCPKGCEDRLEEENVLIVFSSENTDAESLPYSFIRPIMKNCTSNIIAVGVSNEISTSELTKIALGTPDRVLRVASTFDLDEETISKIEDMIEEGPIVSTTQGANA